MAIRTRLLFSRDGTVRRDISYHVPSSDDPDAVRAFHARHPPEPHICQDTYPGEVEFDHEPTEDELRAAFPNRGRG